MFLQLVILNRVCSVCGCSEDSHISLQWLGWFKSHGHMAAVGRSNQSSSLGTYPGTHHTPDCVSRHCLCGEEPGEGKPLARAKRVSPGSGLPPSYLIWALLKLLFWLVTVPPLLKRFLPAGGLESFPYGDCLFQIAALFKESFCPSSAVVKKVFLRLRLWE